MKPQLNSTSKRSSVKILFIALIALVLLIPLAMIRGIIDDRQHTKYEVTAEIVDSYASNQFVSGPTLQSTVVTKAATDSTAMETKVYEIKPSKISYDVDVTTDVLTRSIYDVITYQSTITITGSMPVVDEMLKAQQNMLDVGITDFKGLSSLPQITFGEETFIFKRSSTISSTRNYLSAEVTLPKEVKAGDSIAFSMVFDLKGTDDLMFTPEGEETNLTIQSSYPHPSFQGNILPHSREVTDDGFIASWSVLDINLNHYNERMGVKFVDPANPYQQAERSIKYGLLIICLVFVAGLFVEYLTQKEINIIQYAVIGLSLVLFYILLLSISEVITFGWSYLIAALMTTGALVFYFRAIFKSRSAYVLGGFVAAVYLVNFILLQMETYALLAGSLVLFALLLVVMYLTANMNKKPLDKATVAEGEEAEV